MSAAGHRHLMDRYQKMSSDGSKKQKCFRCHQMVSASNPDNSGNQSEDEDVNIICAICIQSEPDSDDSESQTSSQITAASGNEIDTNDNDNANNQPLAGYGVILPASMRQKRGRPRKINPPARKSKLPQAKQQTSIKPKPISQSSYAPIPPLDVQQRPKNMRTAKIAKPMLVPIPRASVPLRPTVILPAAHGISLAALTNPQLTKTSESSASSHGTADVKTVSCYSLIPAIGITPSTTATTSSSSASVPTEKDSAKPKIRRKYARGEPRPPPGRPKRGEIRLPPSPDQQPRKRGRPPRENVLPLADNYQNNNNDSPVLINSATNPLQTKGDYVVPAFVPLQRTTTDPETTLRQRTRADTMKMMSQVAASIKGKKRRTITPKSTDETIKNAIVSARMTAESRVRSATQEALAARYGTMGLAVHQAVMDDKTTVTQRLTESEAMENEIVLTDRQKAIDEANMKTAALSLFAVAVSKSSTAQSSSSLTITSNSQPLSFTNTATLTNTTGEDRSSPITVSRIITASTADHPDDAAEALLSISRRQQSVSAKTRNNRETAGKSS